MMDHITASLTLAPAVGMHQERDVLKRPRYWDGFLLDFGADPPLVEQGNELLVKQCPGRLALLVGIAHIDH